MTRNLLLSAFATSLLLSTVASAQTPENQGQGMMAACRAELASFCQNVDAGHGRKLGCLADNKTKLGAECAAALETRLAQKSDASANSSGDRDARRARMAACRSDAASLCQNVERGGGRRIACLKENQAKLSPACAEALSSLH